MDVADRPAGADLRRHFLEHPESEILEDRHGVGQRDQAAAAIGLDPKLARLVAVARRNRRTPRSSGSAERGQANDVLGALLGKGPGPIAVGEFARVAERQPGRARRSDTLDQGLLDRGRPAANHLREAFVERLRVRRRRVIVDILGVADQREVALARLDRPAGDLRDRQPLPSWRRSPRGAAC